jgi:signal transduction histidine kinase
MSHDDFAHELRTPLTAVRGAIDLLSLRNSVQGDPQAEALLRLAQRNLERLLLAVEEAVRRDAVDREAAA